MSLLGGKVVVVTGGGRGIGRAHAIATAAAGASVVVNDLGVNYAGEREATSPAVEVVAQIQREGGKAVADYNDIADWRGTERLLETALNAFGGADVLINNAAIIRPSPFIETREADLDEVLRVNIKGTFAPMRVFAEFWNKESAGRYERRARSIICTTSRIGVRGTPYYLTYGCTKAAVAYLVEAAAAELAPLGVRVNGIAPRADTRMMGDATSRLMEIAGEKGLQAVFRSTHSRALDAREPEPPESISPLAVWLASDRSAPLSGMIFSAMAGRIGLIEGRNERHLATLQPSHNAEDVDRALASLK
jgi:NAD(P)-dependent dehydrogenase (short-subunit alcohol dehydrogenase family)